MECLKKAKILKITEYYVDLFNNLKEEGDRFRLMEELVTSLSEEMITEVCDKITNEDS